MGLFGRKKDTGGAPRRSRLALPVGTTVSSSDLDHLLSAWAGVGAGSQLPGGLTWGGPVAADADAGEPGAWVYTLTWPEPERAPRPPSAYDPRLMTDIDVAIDLLALVADRFGSGDDGIGSGPGAFAVAATTGLARRSGGWVQRPGEGWAPAPDPEATWSVYLARRPEADEVVAALGDLLPGLATADLALATWVLEAPDGRGLWLSEVDLDAGDDAVSAAPSTVALCALAALRSPTLWAVRVEGADDTADADTRAGLDLVARRCAEVLGGVAVDAEGFPLQQI
jgi:hypothetical protein